MEVLTILILTNNRLKLELFAEQLQKIKQVEIHWALSFQSAQEFLRQKNIDVLVVEDLASDNDVIDFVYGTLKATPFLNVAMISDDSHEKFHEKTEGMGIFMQLPREPCEVEATEMIEKLQSIQTLLEK